MQCEVAAQSQQLHVSVAGSHVPSLSQNVVGHALSSQQSEQVQFTSFAQSMSGAPPAHSIGLPGAPLQPVADELALVVAPVALASFVVVVVVVVSPCAPPPPFDVVAAPIARSSSSRQPPAGPSSAAANGRATRRTHKPT